MLNAVFDQRLQEHSWYHDVQGIFFDLLHDLQLVAKSHHLDVQVVVGELEFLTEREEGLAVLQQHTQDICQLENHLARQLRL